MDSNLGAGLKRKPGKPGKAIVSYDGWVGTTKARNLPELLNAYQYVEIKNEGLKNAGLFNQATRSFNLQNDAAGNVIDTKWYDYIYRTGYSHNNTIGVSGGSESTNYYISAGYT